MNYVHIIGRLGRDPEVRYTSDNQKVTTLTIASSYKKSGKEETIWWRATLWGDRWDKMVQYLSKGKPVMVGGEMRKPQTYKDKSGETQLGSIDVTAEYVKFVPYGNKEENNASAGAPGESFGGPQSGMQTGSGMASSEEEPLPF